MAANASAGDIYEEYLFKAEALRVLHEHGAMPSPQPPLFLYYAAHVAHQPYEVPDSYNSSFSFIADPTRRAYHAMVACLDDVLAQVRPRMCVCVAVRRMPLSLPNSL